jgi:predicted MFS family arabinose efflux permease
MRKHWFAIVMVVLAALVTVFVLIEPFLPLPPIWEQASVGIVLVAYGAILMFGTVAVQKWIEDYRAAKRLPKRVRFGNSPRDRQDS